ncbi:cupin domain-containing protein [Flammeovirga agarivorans]|uniref:Cupin n=1 Tax=Flammeovirga agarivorans TaxID=2726742 RepID=A0A7X8SQ52_9BACT|nr:cupin [Flammeovirga agarivorans]NLR94285.1 cupin [Flammeovirga agarivorans]
MKKSNIYQDLQYSDVKPMISVLFETEFTKEIRIAMKEGSVMKEHKAPTPIVIEMVKGNIDFGVNNEILHLAEGDLLTLDGHVPHDLKATKDSIVRLTLTKYDDSNRVKNVAK